MTYYKVISKDNKSCHGGDFDWTPYLPKGTKPGKWTPEIKDTEECYKGYHVTQYWNMWYKEEGCRIFECEVKGCTHYEQSGMIEKAVCSSIRLVKEIFPVFDKNLNTGSWNTGSWNTGDSNTGSWNTGNRNTGDWNKGNRNTGFFNTIDPDIQVFNSPCKRENWENANKPGFIYFNLNGTYEESWRKAYDSASDEEKLLLVKLPNFNAKVFQEISGILVDEKTGQEIK